jgi:hypothetical protein
MLYELFSGLVLFSLYVFEVKDARISGELSPVRFYSVE